MWRLATFASYRNEKNVFLCRLSEAGFSYQGYDDALECESCRFKSNSWTDVGDLFEQHADHAPRCQFVQQSRRSRIAPSADSKNTCKREAISNCARAETSSTNVYPKLALSQINGTKKQNPPSDSLASDNVSNRASAKSVFQNLGIHIDGNRSKFSSYAVLVNRVQSYKTANNVFHKPAPEMAMAGFFYKGYCDCVCCFSCGGSLSEWRPNDDPWIEHAYWFPECTFLIQNKGEEFVQQIQLIKKADDEQKEITTGQNMYSGLDEIDSVALCSVLEMGYTQEQARAAFDYLRAQKPSCYLIRAADLVDTILLQEEATSVSSDYVPFGQGRIESLTEKQFSSMEPLDVELNQTDLLDLQTVQKEYQELQDLTICKVCMVEKVSIVFLPCGHIVTCAECAPAMRNCPICRKLVKGTVRAFMS